MESDIQRKINYWKIKTQTSNQLIKSSFNLKNFTFLIENEFSYRCVDESCKIHKGHLVKIL